jgi:hypothetical protein
MGAWFLVIDCPISMLVSTSGGAGPTSFKEADPHWLVDGDGPARRDQFLGLRQVEERQRSGRIYPVIARRQETKRGALAADADRRSTPTMRHRHR